MRMRTEEEMMGLILRVAEEDERIRAVAMEGSRTNPNAPKDPFQDFDIVYFVTDKEAFIHNPQWIDVFGERMIMQTPEAMAMFPPDLGNSFSYLMQFMDGNRIDLTLTELGDKDEFGKADKLCKVLMDKDDILPVLPEPTDADYLAKKPSAEYFADCCNEFWWVSAYVAKGLWRREILYAQEHLNGYMRPMLMKMLEWRVGVQTDYSVSIGKAGKYLERYLPEERWKRLLATYADGSYESVWKALIAMCELFRDTAVEVADSLRYDYPHGDDERVTAYLKHVEALPQDAKTIY